MRHAITRIFHRLIEEHGADVSYPMVRRYVSDRKPEILAASGQAPVEAFVLQTHLPGHEAEVDFGNVTVRLAGELLTGGPILAWLRQFDPGVPIGLAGDGLGPVEVPVLRRPRHSEHYVTSMT